MSLAAFQSALAELVAGRTVALDSAGGLTDLERRRVEGLAEAMGARAMRTLYFGWRLTKVLSLLPFTTALLGDERLSERLKAFWQQRNATSLYFVEECLEFLEFLEATMTDAPRCWPDVLAFERARLRLRADQSRGRLCAPQLVRFRSDPAALFAGLNSGTALDEVPNGDVTLRGDLTDAGEERWTFVASRVEAGA
jgi:hypothetical protein